MLSANPQEYWVPVPEDRRIYSTPKHGDCVLTWCRGTLFAHPLRRNATGSLETNTLAYLEVPEDVMLEKIRAKDFKFARDLH